MEELSGQVEPEDWASGEAQPRKLLL